MIIINSRQPSPRAIGNIEIETPRDVWVNFGQGVPRGRAGRRNLILNKWRAIQNCKDKNIMKDLFVEAGVRTPQHLFTPVPVEEARQTFAGQKIIYKPHNHSRGRGLIVFEDGAEFTYDDIRTQRGVIEQFVRFSNEYRIHVFDTTGNGDYIAISCDRKRRREGVERQDIRHADNYYYWRVQRLPADVVNVAIAAVASLGMDFGAADIGWDGERAWALEVNSAPGMRESLVDRYRYHIAQRVIHHYSMDINNPAEFTNAEGVTYSEQLTTPLDLT